MIHAFFLSYNVYNLFDQAEELFDAASRYLLFPLKRAVADALLPHLEMVPPAELCHWLILSDMYVFLVLLSLLIVIHFGMTKTLSCNGFLVTLVLTLVILF